MNFRENLMADSWLSWSVGEKRRIQERDERCVNGLRPAIRQMPDNAVQDFTQIYWALRTDVTD
jgi:hypothetical protein